MDKSNISKEELKKIDMYIQQMYDIVSKRDPKSLSSETLQVMRDIKIYKIINE